MAAVQLSARVQNLLGIRCRLRALEAFAFLYWQQRLVDLQRELAAEPSGRFKGAVSTLYWTEVMEFSS